MTTNRLYDLPVSVPAIQYECPHWRDNPGHTHGDGKPRRVGCQKCGATLRVMYGTYAALPHRQDNRYTREDAVRTFATRAKAEKWIDANDTTGTLVARFLRP